MVKASPWYIKERCPFCNHKLAKIEGLFGCTHRTCPLFYSRGWRWHKSEVSAKTISAKKGTP